MSSEEMATDSMTNTNNLQHITISVDDIDASCARFEDLKVNWEKRLTDLTTKDLAVIADPDGYRIK